jgi:hypothetical protein
MQHRREQAHEEASHKLIDAAALEEELHRMGSVAREAQRLPLDSQRNLERTQEKLAELGAADERLQPLVGGLMAAVKERTELIDRAAAVGEAAQREDFTDIARQADSLRQQLLSARSKLRLLAEHHEHSGLAH